MKAAVRIIGAIALCAANAAAKEPFHLPRGTGQVIVVTTKDWSATQGTLRRFVRGKKAWDPVGEPIPVVVGRSGLAWGRGMEPSGMEKVIEGPVKHEGDGKAPAGVFELLEATGYSDKGPAGMTMHYRQATDRLRCVDDVDSPKYNLVVEAPADGKTPWKSDEKMKRADELYAYTVAVGHN